MTEPAATRDVPLEDEIAAAEAACRDALATDYPGFANAVPSAPKTPQDCFEFLRRIPERECERILSRSTAEAVRSGIRIPYVVERHLVLQAYLAALPRLRTLHIEESVNRQYCATCCEIASLRREQDHRLAHHGDPFEELAKIVTFRRFHAGQLSFDVIRKPLSWPLRWLLMVHPFEVPRLAREIVSGIGLVGPVVVPHLCYWRPKPMLMLKNEEEHALWRITKFIERDPRIKGFVAMSWLYSDAVGESFPHLAWVRDLFVEYNAYIVDLAPALPEAGFLVGSEKRRRLYAEGKFRPRETLVVWRRSDVLAWAKGHRQAVKRQLREKLPSSSAEAAPEPLKYRESRTKWRIRSGQFTLIDCRRLLFYSRFWYVIAILLPPALFATVFVATFWTIGLGFLTFVVVFVLMWIFQYFFLQ